MDASVPPARAATVLLLREDDGPAGFSVFMVRRSESASFMPGAYVFPGGRVDPGDSTPEALARVGLDDAAIITLFSGGLPADDGRACLLAAVREVAEEALITLPDPSALRPWSRWITPEIERKRFDTWFLVAVSPPNAQPGHDAVEVTASAWVDPVRALACADDGMIFAPPTWYTLWELGRHAGMAAVLDAASRRVVRPVRPRFQTVDDTMAIVLPGDALYPSEHPMLGPTRIVVGANGRWWGVGA